jgi:hypothetical protein
VHNFQFAETRQQKSREEYSVAVIGGLEEFGQVRCAVLSRQRRDALGQLQPACDAAAALALEKLGAGSGGKRYQFGG